LSTHILPEVEAMCDRALVISKGSLVAEGTIDALRKRRRSRGVRVAVSGAGDVRKLLLENPAIEEINDEGDGKYTVTWLAEVEDLEAAAERVAAALVAAGFGLRELAPVKPSLEQVFAELTQGPT
jgi:ABC-2 type transport system ATP-binding protein